MRKLTEQFKTVYVTYPLKTTMALSFLIPILLYLSYYIAVGVFPFGNSTMYSIDLDQQYSDFYQYYRDTLLGNWDAVGYSFTKGIGGEMAGTWSYYLMSPFLLILLLIPQAWMPAGVSLIVLLKIGTAGAAFQFLLGRLYNDANWKSVLYSISYTMIGYFSAYHLNVMWLDALAFLPFAIWGVEKLTRGKGFATYTLWLATIIITNYYIGYMACIFMVLYAIYAVIKNNKTWRERRSSIIKFTVGSILAGLIASFVIIPTLHALSISKGGNESPAIIWAFLYPPINLFSKFTLGSYNQLEMANGLPNIHIGSLGLLTAVYYFIEKRIPRKERITAGVIVTFFIISMSVDGYNLLWHGGQYPIWFPFRFSFLVSFFLLLIGYQYFRQLKEFSLSHSIISVIFAGLITTYLIIQTETDIFEHIDVGTILVTFGIITVITLLLILWGHFPKTTAILLSIITIGELFASTAYSLYTLPYANYENISEYSHKTNQIIDEYAPVDDSFYRIEKTFRRSRNESMQFGYYGISHFNSTLESSTSELMAHLGIPQIGHEFTYNSGTQFTDALFGIKYYMTSDPSTHYTFDKLLQLADEDISAVNTNMQPLSIKQDLSQYELVQEQNGILIYENKNALPLGFGVSSNIIDIDLPSYDTPAQKQEALAQVITNEDHVLYELSKDTNITTSSINVAVESIEEGYSYQKIDEDDDASLTYSFTIPSDDPYYILIPILQTGPFEMTVNDIVIKDTAISYTPWFINIGNQDANKDIDITLHFTSLTEKIVVDDLLLYRSTNQTVPEISEQLKTQSFNIDTFNQSHITGSIETLKDNQHVLFTFPYSKGWTATVDGEKVEMTPLLDGSFTGIQLPDAGEYNIELSYNIPGLSIGISISLLSLGGLAIYTYRQRKKA